MVRRDSTGGDVELIHHRGSWRNLDHVEFATSE
jgi:hypothetical protein